MSIQDNFSCAKFKGKGAGFLTLHLALCTLHFTVIGSSYAVDNTDAKIEGFNLEGFGENGEKAWEVNSEKADVQGTGVVLSNVVAHSYGDENVQLTAQTGSVDQVTEKVILKDDVVIRNENGSRLTTDSLEWDRKADLITTDDPVKLVDNNLMVTGTGMETRPGLKQTKVEEDVKVRVRSDDEELKGEAVIISSDGPMSIDQANQSAVFEDNVKVTQDDKILRADRVEVQFSQETKKIVSMVCTGNVEVTQGINKTYAEKAVYNTETKKLELFGRPKLILDTQGQDVLTPFRN